MSLVFSAQVASDWDKNCQKGEYVNFFTADGWLVTGVLNTKVYLQRVGTWLYDLVIVTQISAPEPISQDLMQAVNDRKLLAFISCKNQDLTVDFDIKDPPED